MGGGVLVSSTKSIFFFFFFSISLKLFNAFISKFLTSEREKKMKMNLMMEREASKRKKVAEKVLSSSCNFLSLGNGKW